MTKAEKWTIALSLIAIVISIVAPLVTFYMLNDYELKNKYRAKLSVSTTEMLVVKPNSGYSYITNIVNEGKESAEEIVLYLKPTEAYSWPKDIKIEITPHAPYQKSIADGALKIVLDRSLGSRQSTQVEITGLQPLENTLYGLIEGRVYYKNGEAEYYYRKAKNVYISRRGF
jgi:hypothetical protein